MIIKIDKSKIVLIQLISRLKFCQLEQGSKGSDGSKCYFLLNVTEAKSNLYFNNEKY